MDENKYGIGSRLQHAQWGQGVVTGVRYDTYLITFVDQGTKEIQHDDIKLEWIEAANVKSEVETMSEVEDSLLGILRQWNGFSEVVPLGDKWKGGVMELKPLDKTLKPKEIPVENFFHKIVMLRDRLRVLEQQINANKKLSDEEKIDLQQYITRCYGSLTTFNILFKNKEQQFVGEKGKED
ncbi:MAG TPA: hypothetical protein DCQ93_07880 [Bacteroidetes bacterium]|nr:hypothetical protein [Bacteroidota bacterium]